MNCKPGDLAYIVQSDAGNEGVVVEVIRLCDERTRIHGEPTWLCRTSTPRITNMGFPDTESGVQDRRLRPISGVPVHDEEHDETPIKEAA